MDWAFTRSYRRSTSHLIGSLEWSDNSLQLVDLLEQQPGRTAAIDKLLPANVEMSVRQHKIVKLLIAQGSLKGSEA
ncbi:MAG: hypothetical protein WBF93_17975 [Pirellulales bacterium]